MKMNKWSHLRVIFLSTAIFSISLIVLICTFTVANADNQSSAQSEVDNANSRLAQIDSEYEQAANRASNLQAEIEETTQKAFQAQENVLNKQTSLNAIATNEYKNGAATPFLELLFSSNSLDDFIKKLDYANRIMKAKTDAIQEQKTAKAQFDSILNDLSAKSDELNSILSSAASKKSEAEQLLGDAKSKLDAQKNTQQQQANPTPSKPDIPDVGDWSSGVASAYNTGTTATGAPVTETSMGISIPMSLPNYRSLYGHTVLIKIGGTTVIGTVNDCGGLAGGARCMDVQPGIYHAFGYGSASAWGLRNVQYKIL